MAPSTSGAARPFSKRKAGRATPTLMPGTPVVSHDRELVAYEASRTLRSIWVTVFLQVRFRSLVRQRLAKPLVSEALTGTRRGHTPCKLAR
jgi:hypothetical protein